MEPSSDTDIVNKTVDTDENETVMLSAKPGEATEIHTLDDVIVEDEEQGGKLLPNDNESSKL